MYCIEVDTQSGDKVSGSPLRDYYVKPPNPVSELKIANAEHPGATKLDITWMKPQDSRVDGYLVTWNFADGNDKSFRTSATSAQITGLHPGRKYHIEVRSISHGKKSEGKTWNSRSNSNGLVIGIGALVIIILYVCVSIVVVTSISFTVIHDT